MGMDRGKNWEPDRIFKISRIRRSHFASARQCKSSTSFFISYISSYRLFFPSHRKRNLPKEARLDFFLSVKSAEISARSVFPSSFDIFTFFHSVFAFQGIGIRYEIIMSLRDIYYKCLRREISLSKSFLGMQPLVISENLTEASA